MIKFSILSILTLLLFSSCKSQLSKNEKQLIYDRYESRKQNDILKIVDLTQLGPQHSGKYYNYKEFEIKAKVTENCSANLIPKIAVDEIITLSADSTDDTYLRQFKTGDELSIKGILFLPNEAFNLPDISNCIFYLKSENIPKDKLPSGCIDGKKYYNKSISYIKLAFPEIYEKMSQKNFVETQEDTKGLFYWGAMLENIKILRQFNSNVIDKRTYQLNKLNIWIELFCNFEMPEIICKN